MSTNFQMQYGRLNLNSHNTLSAKSFVKKNDNLYEKDFIKILRLCILAHTKMYENEKDLDGKDEDKLRNILMKYMQDNRGEFGLGKYNIDAESAENDELTYQTVGYCDLKITIPTNDDWSNEPYKYFTIECKRLDGTTQKSNLYVAEGMHRFITEKYSKNMNIGGMIGFIENNKNKKSQSVNDIVKQINKQLVEKFLHQENEKLISNIINENFFNSFESNHEIKHNNRTIKLTHLFFDNRTHGCKAFVNKVCV